MFLCNFQSIIHNFSINCVFFLNQNTLKVSQNFFFQEKPLGCKSLERFVSFFAPPKMNKMRQLFVTWTIVLYLMVVFCSTGHSQTTPFYFICSIVRIIWPSRVVDSDSFIKHSFVHAVLYRKLTKSDIYFSNNSTGTCFSSHAF